MPNTIILKALRKVDLSKPRAKLVLRNLAFLILPVLFFITFLVLPPQREITEAFHNANYILALLLIFFFSVLLSMKGNNWELTTAIVVLFLFSLPLIYRWQTGFYNGNLIGGILPFSDAGTYYNDAQNLLFGSRFSPFSSRRPIFAGFLAVLLFITRNNLQMTLAVMVALSAICIYLLAREVMYSHGPLVSAFVLVGCFIFYKQYEGVVLTENLGISFGALGLAVLWRGARTKQSKLAVGGLFILSLALNIRAGAFFVLPAIVLWGSIYFAQERRFSVSFFVMSTFVILLSFLINFGMLKLIGAKGATNFSNYSYTFYGLVVGNKGWTQVKVDYPGIHPDKIWSVAILKLKDNPHLFVEGVINSYLDYFKPRSGAFSFTFFSGKTRNLTNIVMWVLSLLGIAYIVIDKNRKMNSLVLILYVGILFSVSLVPPIDSGFMRVYAVTIPITTFLAANGLSFPTLFIKKSSTAGLNHSVSPDDSNHLILNLGLGLVLVCIVGPILLKYSGQPVSVDQPALCSKDQIDIELIFYKGSYFVVVPDHSVNESYLPYIRISDLKRIMEKSRTYPDLRDEILALGENNAVINSINFTDLYYNENYGHYLYNVFLATNYLPQYQQMYKTCGTLTESDWLQKYRFYYADNTKEDPISMVNVITNNAILIESVRKIYIILFLIVIITASGSLIIGKIKSSSNNKYF